MLIMYLYGEGLVSCKNLFPIQLYIYIDNKIIIKYEKKIFTDLTKLKGSVKHRLPSDNVLLDYVIHTFLIDNRVFVDRFKYMILLV